MTKIAIAADHAGYPIKDFVAGVVRKAGYEAVDLGTHSPDAVDYPDMSRLVAQEIQSGRAERGILICGSGIGACIAANKFRGIRAGTCHDTFSARQCVEDDAANVLCLGARVIGTEVAGEVIRAFLGARFSDAERHNRRLNKVLEIERETGSSR